jgi:hypothetical protein
MRKEASANLKSAASKAYYHFKNTVYCIVSKRAKGQKGKRAKGQEGRRVGQNVQLSSAMMSNRETESRERQRVA